MPVARRKVEEAMARLLPVLRRVAVVKGYDDIVPRPNPPASEKDLKKYEDYLGLRLPETYRAFLQLHDGYDWLLFAGSLLPFRTVMPGGAYFERIREWKRTLAENGDGDALDGIVIGNLGADDAWVFLDPDEQTAAGEWTVVLWDTDEPEVFLDLPALLDGVAALCTRILQEP